MEVLEATFKNLSSDDLGVHLLARVCPIGKVDRNINALKYIDIIESELRQVLARHFKTWITAI